MAERWNYANLVSKAKAYGGPETYTRLLKKMAYQNGYKNGKAVGIQKGITVMIPFVIGTSYLLYDKAPQIWQTVREKLHLITKKEVHAVEQLVEDKFRLERKCPCCGKEVYDINEIIKVFEFDKTEEGEVILKGYCKECEKEFNEKSNKN